ncbi:cystathionine beta-synthase [Bifidobacterium bifidum BGN4]|jgi:cystathionine beta-synthase|uniref:Cystathionine beta-synthase n=6 Tax=Bifidobacterium bifidum TaxID=1681 RepID=I3WJ53_BIFBI|nr:cystathionine beta-synthase [Bifidobacterium bifidum BGN4]ALE11817.1 Cystathionine beta-synthase [Bifidobacterium bifidum]EFR50750.1 putative cystathionine beta-synthase [Bifidobacterium bifidum NCIMB 41171]BAQ98540.1 cystathionine beta-synthase [Bifidobacterium bifidum ATCC 29521 = JCM 1255 = DSM 20456]BBA55597.1 cystathionine beta-synthase [Bifidobacterium bifidum]
MSHDWHNNICSRSYNGTAKTNTIIDDHHPPVSTAFNPSARYTKPNNAPIETQKETGSTMTIHNSLSELIGNTPLVKLHHVTDGIKATIAVKVEYFNPGGSSKDRIAERIIDAAERSGQLKPGGVIVEPTSGNTGVGLALVAQQRGYRTIFTLPDKVSESKRAVLRAYGAEVVVTPTDAGPDDPRSYYQVAERLANTIPGGFRPNQYDNPNGPLSHYYTTGPEIWEATDHKVTHFVAGIGTGGTISGTGKYLKEVSDGAVTVVGSDPEGSIYSDPSDVHQYDIEGVGEDFYPKAFDRNITDDIVQVTDREAFEMTRRLAAEEGLLVGGSSGMAVVSALKYAREHDLDSNQVVVVLLPDSGRSYLEKIFNDDWMRENGYGDIVERTSRPSLAEQYL